MMKKAVMLFAFPFFALSANAECRITSVRGDEISTAFKQYGGWKIPEQKFNQICAKLNRARARIQINGMATVLINQSIGWASLSVIDFDTGVGTSDFASMNTQVNTYASQDKANELMVSAMNAALMDWDGLDKALVALNEERMKAKTIFSKQR